MWTAILKRYLPNNQRDAQSPGSSKVWIFKDRGILCKGVVMDDGGLLILEGFANEPLLADQ